jgi:drug/metabolite transporter (DMT)-like permease
MSLFLLTLVAPAMWALSNHFDKFIVSRYFNDASLGAMMVFSGLIGFAVLPVAYFFQEGAFSLDISAVTVLIFNGTLYLTAVLMYLLALRTSDTATVVPIFQIIPVLTYILAFFVLGETLSTEQLLGGALIIIGAFSISIELGSGRGLRWRRDILGLMFLSSLIFSLQFVLFKAYAVDVSFWNAMFWESAGFALTGVLLLLFHSSFRRDFLSVFVSGGLAPGLHVVGEACNITAKIVFNYVSLLVPITIAWAGVGFQPLFVLAFSVILTLFLPQVGRENVLGKHLVHKAASVAVMLIGAYILNS